MHLIRLSPTTGINGDQLVSWSDYPDNDYGPLLVLVMNAPSENEYAQHQPHEIRLGGDERERMLQWIEYAARPSYHMAHA